MAGHSHWANIAHKKGRIDASRGRVFGKLSKLIIVAAKRGGDPAANLALRYAIDRAKKQSMPADTIERAIKKGTGELETEQYDEVLYEGYGPAGVAVMCDILTENRNRTAGEIRRVFEHNGGNLGATGCVAWMFDRKGLFIVPCHSVAEDRVMDLVLEAGASDFDKVGEHYEILCPPDSFTQVNEVLHTAKIPTVAAEISRIPQNTVTLTGDAAAAMVKLLDELEDNDDVQNVTSNFTMEQS